MKLTELINPPSLYKVTIDKPTHWSVEQEIGNRKIIIDCEKNSEGIWEFDFYEVDSEGEWSTEKTGSGSALKVRAMVKKAFAEFVHKYNPEALTFAADMSSRASIYHRDTKRILGNGYTEDHHFNIGAIRFLYTKK